jgi:CheY-like chemotaxis protein
MSTSTLDEMLTEGRQIKGLSFLPRSASDKKVTVLVVEDEFLVRMEIADRLRGDDFVVLEAGHADEAISILEARSDIQLVFTDIDMPGSMDGLKLAAYVRDRWPPIKLIVTSGHMVIEESRLPTEGRFFPKPYDHFKITSAIAQLIAAEAR